jgi:hypothetical protein
MRAPQVFFTAIDPTTTIQIALETSFNGSRCHDIVADIVARELTDIAWSE